MTRAVLRAPSSCSPTSPRTSPRMGAETPVHRSVKGWPEGRAASRDLSVGPAMKIRVSSRGRIVLPAEIRRRDRILAGDELEVERLHTGRHRLPRAFRLQINRSSHRTSAYAEKRPFAARFAEIAIREIPAGLHRRPGGEDLRSPGEGPGSSQSHGPLPALRQPRITSRERPQQRPPRAHLGFGLCGTTPGLRRTPRSRVDHHLQLLLHSAKQRTRRKWTPIVQKGDRRLCDSHAVAIQRREHRIRRSLISSAA
jgi:AbrB family looped-hinge helix DNA binding protein